MTQNKTLAPVVIGIIVILAVLGLLWYFVGSKNVPSTLQHNQNTQTQQNQTGFETHTDTQAKVSFQYPSNLGTHYIATVDWPPKIQIAKGPFSCTEGGSETEQAGKTTKVTINGHVYCMTKFTQGAAGSLYNLYAYGFEKNGKVVILAFSLRFPQCDNYEDPQKTECKNEESSFNVNAVVDQIAQSVTF